MKYNVEKCITIDSKLDHVRSLIEDFNQWKSWSPWTVIEPTCSVDIEGEPSKVGHKLSWDGKVIGAGENKLRQVNSEALHYDLELKRPWKSKSKTSFLLKEDQDKTQVTWTLESRVPFFLFFMVKTLRNMIGMDYDRGLRILKRWLKKEK